MGPSENESHLKLAELNQVWPTLINFVQIWLVGNSLCWPDMRLGLSENESSFRSQKYSDGNSLSYGSYYYCELLGSGQILSFLLMLVTAILNFKQIRKLITASGVPALKGWKYLKVKQHQNY